MNYGTSDFLTMPK